MEIIIRFSAEELALLRKALNFGSIHTIEEKESHQMMELESKIGLIGNLKSLEKKLQG